jgi:hypothetical protein
MFSKLLEQSTLALPGEVLKEIFSSKMSLQAT